MIRLPGHSSPKANPEPAFNPTPVLSRESQAFLRWVAHNHGADLANRWQNQMLCQNREHRAVAESIAYRVMKAYRQQVWGPAFAASAIVTAVAFGLYALLRGIAG